MDASDRDGPRSGETLRRADGSLPRPWYESWTRKFFNAVLAFGPLPKHIGFIMDGNRRFAQKRSMEKIVGHTMGFNKLKEALEWCFGLGVGVVTVYAFSIENFKRSPEEVSTLMRLAAEKFDELLNEEDIIHKHGVSIRVLGDISLVPDYLQHSMATAIHKTRNNTNTRRDRDRCQDSLCRRARGPHQH
jgi:ditrans,polycis-polyprenyl diphosphate synthase